MNEDKPPASKRINETLIKMRDSDLIDFTDKKDYPAKLIQIAKDQNCKYETVYKEMKKLAKSDGIMVGEPNKKTKKMSTKGSQTFNFSAKKSSLVENKMAKKQAELDAKKKNLESDLKVQEMILASPVFEMVKAQNYYALSMIKEVVKLAQIPVAPDEQYKAIAGMMANKELQEGWQAPKILTDIILIIGMGALFIIPAIPKIREYLSDEKEEKETKSEEPLDQIENPELNNGEKEKQNETK